MNYNNNKQRRTANIYLHIACNSGYSDAMPLISFQLSKRFWILNLFKVKQCPKTGFNIAIPDLNARVLSNTPRSLLIEKEHSSYFHTTEREWKIPWFFYSVFDSKLRSGLCTSLILLLHAFCQILICDKTKTKKN